MNPDLRYSQMIPNTEKFNSNNFKVDGSTKPSTSRTNQNNYYIDFFKKDREDEFEKEMKLKESIFKMAFIRDVKLIPLKLIPLVVEGRSGNGGGGGCSVSSMGMGTVNTEIDYEKLLSIDILLALIPIVNVIKGIYDLVVCHKQRKSINEDVNNVSQTLLNPFNPRTKTPVTDDTIKNRMLYIKLEKAIANWDIAKGVAEIFWVPGVALFTIAVLVAKFFNIQPKVSDEELIAEINRQICFCSEQIEILDQQKFSTEEDEYTSKMKALCEKQDRLQQDLDRVSKKKTV
jgi:hypothetical protein